MLWRYGLTPADLDKMRSDQKGCCAICGLDESQGVTRRNRTYLAVDHCHTTLKIRKLLCHACNILLGQARESASILTNAILYLKEHTQQR